MSQDYFNRQPISQNQNGRPQYRKNVQPPRPNGPKPQPMPIPIDIDHSQQISAVNYINRPNFNGIARKRPPPSSNQLSNNYPNKFQRINHIAQDTNENNKDYTQYEEMQPWKEYNNEYMRKEQDNPENNFIDFVDVHFLD
ncbi:unnamed protein product [Ceratitis capitata]|uniref:(Mediterranean fruit fly) hypothetical protein n=1 Tax=Ceratitis capitata TaxID=7213 RepID=A0A811UKI8_CERCA|nr:unnamed protein product [Ceratitis capitata]